MHGQVALLDRPLPAGEGRGEGLLLPDMLHTLALLRVVRKRPVHGLGEPRDRHAEALAVRVASPCSSRVSSASALSPFSSARHSNAATTYRGSRAVNLRVRTPAGRLSAASLPSASSIASIGQTCKIGRAHV